MPRRVSRYERILLTLPPAEQGDLLNHFESWLENLIDVNHNVPVLVEGINDRKALTAMGLNGNIFLLHRAGHSIYDRCQDIARNFDEIVILLDSDPKGRRLRRMVIRHLESEWRRYEYIRQELERMVGMYLRHIEELAHFYQALRLAVYLAHHTNTPGPINTPPL